MSKIIFLQDLAYEHIGTMYLAAVLKNNGYECDVLINGLEKDIIKKLKQEKPEIVAFSVITGAQNHCLKMAKEVKKAIDCKIIFGGPHPTHFPEIIKYEHVDYVCIGEGEYALLELAERIKEGERTDNIQNLWCKKGDEIIKNEVRPLIQDLDSLPFPDREIYYKYKKIREAPQKRFMTTRGCPYSCSFCFNHALMKIYKNKGKYVRRRSVNNVIEEITQIKKRYYIKTVYFDDDTFILDKKWVMDFLEEYKKKVNLPFICLIRANLVDETLIKKFKEAKCKSVFFGIETGNEELRNKILKKGLSNNDIINAAKLLHKYKIKFKTYNMLGLPEETIENAFETIALNTKIKTNYSSCSIFQPYPGTELGKYVEQKRYVDSGFNSNDIKPYYSGSSMTNKKDIKKIVNLQRFFILGVKFPRTMPIIKKLINLPPNFLFNIIFILSYAYTYIGSEDISIIKSFFSGIRAIKNLFLSGNKKRT